MPVTTVVKHITTTTAILILPFYGGMIVVGIQFFKNINSGIPITHYINIIVVVGIWFTTMVIACWNSRYMFSDQKNKPAFKNL